MKPKTKHIMSKTCLPEHQIIYLIIGLNDPYVQIINLNVCAFRTTQSTNLTREYYFSI